MRVHNEEASVLIVYDDGSGVCHADILEAGGEWGGAGSTQNSYIMKLISIRSRKSALHLAAQLNTAVLQVFDLASMDCMIRPRLV